MDNVQKLNSLRLKSPRGRNDATNCQNSATNNATNNATNSLKALAGAVLGRNNLRNNSSTPYLNHAQQIDEKNSAFVALNLGGFNRDFDSSDTRRFCRQCQHHRPAQGAFIWCSKLKHKILDDLPRHCGKWLDNGLPPPTTGLFQRLISKEA